MPTVVFIGPPTHGPEITISRYMCSSVLLKRQQLRTKIRLTALIPPIYASPYTCLTGNCALQINISWWSLTSKMSNLPQPRPEPFQLWTQPWGNQPPTQKQYPLQGLQDGVSNRCSAEDVDIH